MRFDRLVDRTLEKRSGDAKEVEISPRGNEEDRFRFAEGLRRHSEPIEKSKPCNQIHFPCETVKDFLQSTGILARNSWLWEISKGISWFFIEHLTSHPNRGSWCWSWLKVLILYGPNILNRLNTFTISIKMLTIPIPLNGVIACGSVDTPLDSVVSEVSGMFIFENFLLSTTIYGGVSLIALEKLRDVLATIPNMK